MRSARVCSGPALPLLQGLPKMLGNYFRALEEARQKLTPTLHGNCFPVQVPGAARGVRGSSFSSGLC